LSDYGLIDSFLPRDSSRGQCGTRAGESFLARGTTRPGGNPPSGHNESETVVMYKMSILDILTTMDESPMIWAARADYWDNVAVRHDRHNRFDQAARLRANVQAMRDRSALLNRQVVKAERETKRLAKLATVPATVPVPAKPDRATLVNAMSRKPVTGGFKDRSPKSSPTIAQAMVRGRKSNKVTTESPDSVH
jgi:hypothetical protein